MLVIHTQAMCEKYTNNYCLGVLCMQMPQRALEMYHTVTGNTIGIFLRVK